jgi:hypothetical protein
MEGTASSSWFIYHMHILDFYSGTLGFPQIFNSVKRGPAHISMRFHVLRPALSLPLMYYTRI